MYNKTDNEKNFLYQIKDGIIKGIPKFISGPLEYEELEKLIYYLQLKFYTDITGGILLSLEDTSRILMENYGFKEEKLTIVNNNVYEIDIIEIWDKMCGKFDDVVYESQFMNYKVEEDLIKILKNYDDFFVFINVATKLPKWAKEFKIEPLSMKITHGGVLIQGLNIISEEERNKIKEFYHECQFYDNDSLFFSFKFFPPFKFTFEWTGRHIRIAEVIESEENQTEVIREMNIGYYLNNKDISFPINNLKELSLLKNKMRLI